MATKAVWVKAMLMVAALGVAAHVQASVTIYNPVGLVVDVVVDGTNVKVVTEVVTVNITQGQQDIQFKVAEGQVLEVNVHDGDVLVLIPDPTDPLHAVQALKIQVGAPPNHPHYSLNRTPPMPCLKLRRALLLPHLEMEMFDMVDWSSLGCGAGSYRLC